MDVPVVPPKPEGEPDTPHVNFIDPTFSEIMKNPNHPEYQNARDFFLCLALNHDVLPETNKSGEVIYSASSPDESALVYAAKHFGFFFKGTEAGGKKVLEMRGPGGKGTKDVSYEVLEFLEFNSDRKRSSVVYKDVGSGKIVLFCKGADNVMKKRLKTPASSKLMSDTEKHLNQ
jgi:phospholipid-transporting ATPase